MKTPVWVLIAVAMVAVACGGPTTTDIGPTTSVGQAVPSVPAVDLADGVAAVVDGVDVLTKDVDEITPAGATPADIADSLRRLITDQVLEAAVAELGIVVSAAQEEAVRARIVEEAIAASELSLAEVLAASGLNEAGFDLIVRQSALADAVDVYLADNAPPPRDEDLQQLFDEEAADRVTVCAAHILVGTDDEAAAARDRALAGEDFGELARELSTGPSGPNGGDLGCNNPGSYVPAFAAATLEADIGTAFGPVETQFGFHVILVTRREVPTLEDLREELTSRLLGDVFPVWLTTQMESAVVVVSPRYGRSVTDPSPGVVPVS